MKKKIAIIGNGKVARALAFGFVKSGIQKESIIIIGRNNENLLYFKENGFDTSVDIQSAKDVSNLILAVTPGGVGYQIKRLHSLSFYSSQKLICICSGINTAYCANFLGTDKAYIVKATINTNIEYNKGIICIAKPELPNKLEEQILAETKELFKKAGKVIFETNENITKSVASVGSMNAFDTAFIAFMCENINISIQNFLYETGTWLKVNQSMHQLVTSKKYDDITKYLMNKSSVLEKEMLYTKTDADTRAIETFRSTILALCCIPNISFADVENHIKKVVTKGGCTEKGINHLKSVDDFLSFDNLCNVLRPVYKRALEFDADVIASFTNNS
jgi:pyrroline-5-carboxylate reductase